jgi:hypothetical protein
MEWLRRKNSVAKIKIRSGRKATMFPERTPSKMKALSLFEPVLSCWQFCAWKGAEPQSTPLPEAEAMKLADASVV